jgi:hypothetical protein
VIACYEYNTGTTLGMAQYSTYYIGMALLPPPSVLLNLPSVNDVAHEIKCFTGVVLEKVVKSLGLAVSSTKMYI